MPFPVDEKYVLQTERKLGVTFPASFRLKMITSNGGELETEEDAWQLYPVFDDTDNTRLKRTCNDIVRETEQARQWQGFPAKAVAIAGNGYGDQLVFLINESEPTRLLPSVYQWDHETGELSLLVEDLSLLVEE
jgi:hypothetical protein